MNDYTKRPPKGKVYIYALLDPDTLEIRYIGKTIHSMNKRLSKHISSALREDTQFPSARWIRKLHQIDKRPTIQFLELANNDNWQEREQHWIAHGRSEGWNLLNLTIGGDGQHGFHMRESTKEKLRKQKQGENSVTAKLSESDVIAIRDAYHNGVSQVEIASMYDVSSNTIGDIVLGRRWKHIGGYIASPQRDFRGEKSRASIVSDEQALEIRHMYATRKYTYKSLGELYGLSREGIKAIVRGLSFTHIPNPSENVRRETKGVDNGMSKLTPEIVRQMRHEYAEGHISQRDIARKYGVSQRTAANAIKRKTWKQVK